MTPSASKAKPAAKKPAAKTPAAPKSAKPKAAAKPRKPAGPAVVLTEADIAAALKKIRAAIVADFPSTHGMLILGIRTRGVVLAERLRALLEKDYKQPVPLGVLDITLYRDDLSTLGPQPQVRESEIPFDITGAHIILVDDVLYTGRTIRAALDEITDFGRPNLIRLAVLADRGGRQYPIQADYVGQDIAVEPDDFVRVRLKEIDNKDEVVVVRPTVV